MKPPSLEFLLTGTKCALLIVDVQNDFCHPEGTFGKNGVNLSSVGGMMEALGRLATAAREKGVPVIFIKNTEDENTDSPAWRARPDADENRTNKGICRRGSWGAELYGFEPEEGDLVLEKHRFSAFLGTPLDEILKAQGVETLVLGGIATNICVETTARHAIMLDYNVVAAEDGCACPFADLHEAAMKNIRLWFGKVANAAEITRIWQNNI